MSNEYRVNSVHISDLELDAILQAADADLTSALESATGIAAGFQSAVIAGLQEPRAPLSDQELDTALQAADADLTSALRPVVETTDGLNRAVIARFQVLEPERAHSTYFDLANGV